MSAMLERTFEVLLGQDRLAGGDAAEDRDARRTRTAIDWTDAARDLPSLRSMWPAFSSSLR